MTHRLRTLKHWLVPASLVALVYACSGSPDVIVRPGDNGDDDNGGGGTSSGRGGAGSGGTTIITGKGGKGGKGGGQGGTGQSGGEAGDDGTGGIRDAGLPDVGFTYDASSGGEGGACAIVTGEAEIVKRPMDVIVVIDNSLSMQGEIQAVQERINEDFAAIIGASDIDYRVIMVSRYGNVYDVNYDNGAASDSAYSICIGSPLSTLNCPDDQQSTTPLVAHNPPRFYHYSADIGSNNMWCRLLDSYDRSDPHPDARTVGDNSGGPWVPIASNGWRSFLRAEAYKVFIGITDDSPSGSGGGGCPDMRGNASHDGTNDQAGADDFDEALRTLGPFQFGALGDERNYVWYSIVGMAGNATTNPTPLTPSDPVVNNCCRANGGVQTNCQGNTAPSGDGANPGQGYQYLSIMTGGLRYPSCYNSNFDAIFNAIAQGVIDRASASCEYEVPPNPNGIIDPAQTRVTYEPGSGNPVDLGRVGDAAACGTGSQYYFNQALDRIFLCPSTCTTVQADPMAKIAIDFGCLGS